MGWRIVSISRLCKLDYKMDYLVMREREETTRIHLSEIDVLILESTAISLTFFFGTLLAYLPFALAGPLRSMVSFAWSYRIWFIVLAVIALVCMLIPVFKLNEKDFVDAEPSDSNAFSSLAKTFRNTEFTS